MTDLVMTAQVGELKGVTQRRSRQAARMRRKTASFFANVIVKLGGVALELAAARQARSRAMRSRHIRVDGSVIPERMERVWNRHSAYLVHRPRVQETACQRRVSTSPLRRTSHTMIPAGEGVRVKVLDYRPTPVWASGAMDWDVITHDCASSPAGRGQGIHGRVGWGTHGHCDFL